MPDLNAVLKHVDNYCAGRVPLDSFEDRFLDDSRGAYVVPGFCDLYASIESLLSDYHFGEGVDENVLRKELAKAVRPFSENRDASSIVSPVTDTLYFEIRLSKNLVENQRRAVDLWRNPETQGDGRFGQALGLRELR